MTIVYKVTIDNKSLIIKNSEYQLEYKIGETTTAKEYTMGIFCHTTIESAKGWVIDGQTIFEVEGIGEPTYVKKIPHGDAVGVYYDLVLRGESTDYMLRDKAIVGTVCFPSVKVLREVKKEYYRVFSYE